MIVTTRRITCDAEGCDHQFPQIGTTEDIRMLRMSAQRAGWQYVTISRSRRPRPGNKDLCPEHTI